MTDTTTDLTERLGTIKGWAADAEPATDSAGAAALRVIGHLCDVVQQLTERVLRLEADVAFLSEEAGVTGDVADHAASYDERIADLEERAAALERTTDVIRHAVVPEAIRRHQDGEYHEAPR